MSMCLAVPFKIISTDGEMAVVEVNGLTQNISIALTPEALPGDWVLVHAGYAIHKIDEAEAKETLKLWEEIHEASQY
ncbi:HypC/HybG/HupF family hydrogenase formation chaperone [Desulfitibacter alkalitolerans]|uniref:HypC/HybG/HupF family hydrogenase formation chaperone n=1 Tax=Desulfitibacter alkalitolerans TaxID=264641 RepID=UPI001FA70834|nr:HypC/HybG/HupF family hydrogenase formation chaperone [Desulfitibacter alkalitolerans]